MRVSRVVVVLGFVVIVACGGTTDETSSGDAGPSSDAGATEVDASEDAAADVEAPVTGAVPCSSPEEESAKDIAGKPCLSNGDQCGSSTLGCTGCAVRCIAHRWSGAAPSGGVCWNYGPTC